MLPGSGSNGADAQARCAIRSALYGEAESILENLGREPDDADEPQLQIGRRFAQDFADLTARKLMHGYLATLRLGRLPQRDWASIRRSSNRPHL